MITAIAAAAEPFAPAQIPLPFPEAPALLPVPVERNDSSAVRDRCARFTQALAEVITGFRPLRQLGPWLSREVYEELAMRVDAAYATPGRHRNPRVVSIHIAMPTPAAAEIAARMVHRGRSHAIALRLQRGRDHQGRAVWRCTAVAWA